MRRRQWLATLGEVSAGMAHEIRNPLAALAGAMQILKKDAAPGEASQRLMDIAIRETARLDNIVTEFLLYARPSALNCTVCDLNELLKEALDLIQHEAQSRGGIKIVRQLAEEPLVAEVDADQLKQVFWNLAMNAFEAMQSGGTLTLTSARRGGDTATAGGEVVCLSFQDTGEGTPGDVLEKILLPFLRRRNGDPV